LRFRRQPQSTIDQVRISRDGSRDGEYALIEHADPAYGSVNLKLGPEIANLTDREILDVFNDIIVAQEASIADPANRPIEIPKKGDHRSNGWKIYSNGQCAVMY